MVQLALCLNSYRFVYTIIEIIIKCIKSMISYFVFLNVHKPIIKSISENYCCILFIVTYMNSTQIYVAFIKVVCVTDTFFCKMYK